MSLNNGKLRKIGGLASRNAGGKMWGYDAGTDTLATVLAADYFLLSTDPMVALDFIKVVHSGGETLIQVVAASSLTVTTAVSISGGVQTIAVAGAIDIANEVSLVESAGAAQAMTLADGVPGQRKTIVHDVDGGSLVLTPATPLGYATITFTTLGETADLVWAPAGWAIVSVGGITLPAIA